MQIVLQSVLSCVYYCTDPDLALCSLPCRRYSWDRLTQTHQLWSRGYGGNSFDRRQKRREYTAFRPHTFDKRGCARQLPSPVLPTYRNGSTTLPCRRMYVCGMSKATPRCREDSRGSASSKGTVRSSTLQPWNCRSSHIWSLTYYLIWSNDIRLSERRLSLLTDSLQNTYETKGDGHSPSSLKNGQASPMHLVLECTKYFQL
jgi:hypothetical protein